MLAALGCVPGLGLVRVQLLDAACLQCGLQRIGDVIGNRRIAAFAAGNGETACDPVLVAPGQALAEQRAVTRWQAIGGCQRPFAGFGAGS
ncbi:hypothetical protein D9M73_283350 [compost metagenome]